MHISTINHRLKSLQTLDSVSRTPRSIDDYSYWKASEMKWFLLAYSLVILNDLMEDKYFRHHILLVNAMTILTSKSISVHDLKEAERCLEQYVTDFETLYFVGNMTLNIHMLLHLVRNVELFGPLWTTSCFPFKYLNSILKNLVKSSKHPEIQVYNAVEMYLHFFCFKDKYLQKASKSYDFYNLALNRTKCKRIMTKISNGLSIVGKYTLCNYQDLLANIRKAIKGIILQHHNLYTFNRL